MLKLQAVSKVFNQGTPYAVQAISGLSLEAGAGEFITLIGSNGAGKSTMLNLIAGLFYPDRGRVEIDGRDVTNLAEHRRAALVGRVFQDPLLGTASQMTVEQNLALASVRGGRRGLGPGVGRKQRADFRNLLAPLGLGLEQRLTTSVGLLSGGQRQALTLLMATLARPAVLLLDEHTAALDPLTSQRINELTVKLVAELGLTTLMVTHNMNMALAMGSRTLMMHQGQVLMDISGPQRATTTVPQLIERFNAYKQGLVSDRMALG